MNIIILTECNGELDRIYTLLKETIADVYVLIGNILDRPFYSEELSNDYKETQKFFQDLMKKMNSGNILLEEFVESILGRKGMDDKIYELGKEYINLSRRAERTIKHKYTTLENIFSQKTNSKIFLLPGDNDIKLRESELAGRDINFQCISLEKKFNITGFEILPHKAPHLSRIENSLDHPKEKNNQAEKITDLISSCSPDIILFYSPESSNKDGKHGAIDFGPIINHCTSSSAKLLIHAGVNNGHEINMLNKTIYLNPAIFSRTLNRENRELEGGFFYNIECREDKIEKIELKKLTGERVHVIARYNTEESFINKNIIDGKRLNALLNDAPFDIDEKGFSHISEVKIFKDIKNFFRIHQTAETEKRVLELENALNLISDEFSDVAIDLVGSANVGLSQKSSDIDMVLYIRGGLTCQDDSDQCGTYHEVEDLIRKKLGEKFEFEVIDYVNLDLVEEGIKSKDLDCMSTQRFVIYRSTCRPVNYHILAPVEDLLNADSIFKKELEEVMQSYFKILFTTSSTGKSFQKYQARLKSLQIEIPEAVIKRIKRLLAQ